MQRAVPAQRLNTRARPWLPPVAFAALLVAYNNLLFGLPGDLASPSAWVFYARAILLPLVAVAWAVRTQGVSLAELGITPRNLLPSAAAGLAAAIVVAVPAVLYLLFSVGVGDDSIDYDRPSYDSVGAFLLWAAVRYPLNAAVFEEVLFRGVLVALALRAFGPARAVVLSAAAYAGWHIVVNHLTMSDSNVADTAVLFAFAQVGALAGLFVGGLILAALRRRSGNLAGPIVFHWLAVVAINAALFAEAR